MEKVLFKEEMQENDEYTIKSEVSSLELMERAGKAIFDDLIHRISKDNSILIIVNSGGNGGDGLVLARLLYEYNYNLSVYLISSNGREEFNNMLKKYKGSISNSLDFDKYNIIVDAIFGIGLNRNIDNKISNIIEDINNSKAYKISIDIPSGLNSNNGMIFNNCIKANLTYVIQDFKIGHFLNHGKDYCGELIKLDIGIKNKKESGFTVVFDKSDYKDLFKKRSSMSNKGDYGKVSIIGGSKNFLGAPILSLLSLTTLRLGVGYSNLCIPESLKDIYCLNNLETIYTYFKDEDGNICFDEDKLNSILNYDVIGIGMGIGKSFEVYKIISYLLKNYTKTLLIDADGLNSLSFLGPDILKDKKCKVIITPHIKEFSRLTNITVEDILNEPIVYVKKFAKEFNVFLVLKSNTTIITDGEDVILNVNGTPSLAKGGSGDLLSGLIMGMVVKEDNLIKRIACGSYLLGRISELACLNYEEETIITSDLINYISKAIKEIKKYEK